LFPRGGDARWHALRLHALGDGMLEAAILARYENALRPEPLRWDLWVANQLVKVDNALNVLERECPASSGVALDIGKICVGCALGYLDFRFADRGWRNGRPRLASWYAELSQRPSFQSTMPG
jgi:glutathione S-transferase